MSQAMHRAIRLFAVIASTASFGFAQVTTAQVPLGGAGGLSSADSCQGTTTPPELDDGTVGTGTLTFRYDQSTHELTLTVENTSPVTTGVDNPLITDIQFNIPAGTLDPAGVSLDSQIGQGPALPTFQLDLSPSQNGCLGRFSVRLCNNMADPTDIKGGIANPAADSHGAPPNSWVDGPVMFVMTLTGPGANLLNANAIAHSFALNSAPGVQVTAAAHFQAGKDGGSAKISSGGGGCRTSIYTLGDPKLAGGVHICVGAAAGCHGCLFGSFNGTPFDFNNVTVPIGMPFTFVLSLPPFQEGANSFCFRAKLPDNDALIGVPFYMTVGTFDAQLNLEFSPQFVMTFLPKD